MNFAKEVLAKAINNYFEDSNPITNIDTQIEINAVCSYSTDYDDLSPKITGCKSEEYDVYLITIDLD